MHPILQGQLQKQEENVEDFHQRTCLHLVEKHRKAIFGQKTGQSEKLEKTEGEK
jgi:hypothetical protein